MKSNLSYHLETKLEPNHQFFTSCDHEIWQLILKNNRAPLLGYFKICASSQGHQWLKTEVSFWKRSIWVKIVNLFVKCDLEIWQMTLKNNRTPLLCYFKLCATFQSHQWIQTGVTVQKCSIWVKIGNFLSGVTLKVDRWPWKTILHLFYATSSVVHHFVTISEFKLVLLSGKAQIGAKFVLTSVTLSFDIKLWP